MHYPGRRAWLGDHAAQMVTIYRRSYITISATAAPDSTHGCFSRRQAPLQITCPLPLKTPFSIYARGYFVRMHEWLLAHEWVGPSNSGLPSVLGRGWCFQERLVASRILHYTSDDIILGCNAGYRCECSGMNHLRPGSTKSVMSNRNFQNGAFATWIRIWRLLKTGESRDSMPKQFDLLGYYEQSIYSRAWISIIENYTKTMLT